MTAPHHRDDHHSAHHHHPAHDHRAAHDPPPDPGLAHERTQLAWTRTTLSLIALGTALIKAAPVPGLAILAMGLACWAAARRLNGPPSTGGIHRRHVPLQAIAVTLTLISLAALTTTLLTAGTRPGPLSPPTSQSPR
ncbi:DUF202 domain-containing protein [Nonomuraea sp. NN258]|uniref:DUF202 domain-containing protein n=1 Tax=Nonomuraea antri TaxID=2730852 RepID=UPI001568DB33|nr:DUF202 domain-containing protein [Nonomuraea antri]NRQ37010.1 DUF202 domain-containing protein [Nonomuraea antri]